MVTGGQRAQRLPVDALVVIDLATAQERQPTGDREAQDGRREKEVGYPGGDDRPRR
jgi:hypothetical protein